MGLMKIGAGVDGLDQGSLDYLSDYYLVLKDFAV